MATTSAVINLTQTPNVSALEVYASDAAFVTAKGSAATEGDCYFNSTELNARIYNGSEWQVLGKDFATNEELDAYDLPNSTTAYGWNLNGVSSFNDGDFVGSTALTVDAGTMVKAADVLGEDTYCSFNGSTRLISEAAALTGANGDMSLWCWAYRASWAAIGAAETLISRFSSSGANNGWKLQLGHTYDEIGFDTYSANAQTSAVKCGFTNLSAGWHHFMIVRDADAFTKLYIDGLRVAQVNDTSQVIGDGGNFDVGCYDSATTAAAFFTGRIDEIGFHNGAVYSDDQVARIYCRSARRFAREIINSAGSSEIHFTSPMEGQLIPFQPKVFNSADTTADLGYAAGGFDDRVCGYRVWKNEVEYFGDVRCHATAPTTVNNTFGVHLPIPLNTAAVGAPSAYWGVGAWSDGGTMYPLLLNLSTNYMLFYLHNAASTYAVWTALYDEAPAAWAENDAAIWTVRYGI